MADDELVKTVVEKLANAAKNQKDKGGWIGSLLFIAVALFAIAVYSWSAWRRARQLAALEHQKTIETERKNQADLDTVIAKDGDILRQANDRADSARKAVASIDAQLEQLKQQKARNEAAIDSIKSWDDIDPGRKS